MSRVCAVSLALLLTAPAWAADPVALRSLFPNEADVLADGPGLVRLDLPPEVIASCLPSLADVRLFDPAGNEVPFLLDTPRVEAVFQSERVEARVLEVRREEIPKANGPSLRRETFELSGPATEARSGTWNLVVDVAHSEFVTRVRVTWSSQEGKANGEAAGSLFRLASPRPIEKLRLPVGSAPVVRFVVVLEHEHPFWLAPSFRFESSRTIDRAGSSAIPLSALSTRSAGGSTVVELSRPRGVVPATLKLDVETATFDRKVTVYDEGPGREAVALGSADVFRLLPGSGVEQFEVPLRAARGDRLRVVIDDGDSPPLAGPTFTAVFAQPSLVASLAETSGQGPAAVLRFGGGRASVPRYDLAGFRPEPGREVYGARAEALIRLYDPAVVRAARLGPVRPNAAFDRTPALAFAMRPGASIDTRSFAKRRSLEVEPSTEGLARLRLGPEDLAVLGADLADLRIVDAGSHQWPYLVDRGAASVDVPLDVTASSKNRSTTYRLSSNTSPLTADRIRVDTDVPFFDREFRLSGVADDGEAIELARGRLVRSAGAGSTVAVDFPAARVVRFELRIEDGDDAPLVLDRLVARHPVPDIFVTAPAGTYAMLLGSAGSASPRYELERVRDVVLAVAAGSVRARPIEANPGYRLSARFTQGQGREQAVLWIAIVLAVLVLGALTLRLAWKQP